MNGFLGFLLGFSIFFNVLAAIAIVIIYKKFIKNNSLIKLSKFVNIDKLDKEFWDL